MKGLIDYLFSRLEIKLLSVILLVLIISFSIMYGLISSSEREKLVEDLESRSRLVADTLHETIDRDMMVFRADIVRHLMDDFKKLEGIERIQIVRGDASYVGAGRGLEEAFKDYKTLDDVKKRIGRLFKAEWETDHPNVSNNIAPGTDHPDFKDFFGKTILHLGEGKVRSLNEGDMKGGMLDKSYFEEVDGVPSLTYLRPLPNFPKCALCHGMDHSLRGILMISASMEGVEAAMKSSKKTLILAFLGTGGVLFLLVRSLMRNMILSPLNDAKARIKEIAEGEGDLTRRIPVHSRDEIGEVGQWFNVFISKLHQIITRVAQTTGKVNSGTQQILDRTNHIMEDADVQIQAIDSTSAGVETMNRSIEEVAISAGSLSESTEETVAAVLEMSSSIEEIARHIAVLSGAVEESSSSVVELSSAAKQIEDNVSSLRDAAEVTTASIGKMDGAATSIQEGVHETVRLARAVSEDAEKGWNATDLTIRGMGKIKEYSQEMDKVFTHLRSRTESIGKILDVIDEVAEQTNLLALNAAIIAAQSGEQGKSFAVVAQEIKELADRTAVSTGEIHEIIRGFQEITQNAAGAVRRGKASVDEGVRLSEEAGSTLKKILKSSDESKLRIQEIAGATDEQNRNAKRIADAMKQVMSMVQEMAKATHEQARGSEFIIQATEKLRTISIRVKEATQEQTSANRQINQIMDGMARKVREIAHAMGSQAEESAKIREAVHRIKVVLENTVNSIGKVGMSVEEMREQAILLSDEVNKFKL